MTSKDKNYAYEKECETCKKTIRMIPPYGANSYDDIWTAYDSHGNLHKCNEEEVIQRRRESEV